ncbi:hypothetical protein ABI_02940 [Asticcacaulis biprosthecium C19]|uniref:Uncharacterized protein n=1 Tax=Asticcacaulis biprosthecium C19 TaxID=715226 RepID=F4QJ31_9CAUL|nr:hypothetical protein [Asticcacaulis biprosthecium]EGF91862.1 hypothetical protein ABI_02940 [Asticcacaulis biprosthecium C19]
MDMLKTAAAFYGEIYRDRRNHLVLLAWFLAALALAWFLLMAQDRWVHADINAAAFDREPAHRACAGYDTTACYGWLAELDQKRRVLAVRSGSCQMETQCASTAPQKDPLVKPAPCAPNGGCSSDKAAWYTTQVCPMAQTLWSRAETGVIRRLILANVTAATCSTGATLMARASLKEVGLSGGVVFSLFGLIAILLSPLPVAVAAFRRIGD